MSLLRTRRSKIDRGRTTGTALGQSPCTSAAMLLKSGPTRTLKTKAGLSSPFDFWLHTCILSAYVMTCLTLVLGAFGVATAIDQFSDEPDEMVTIDSSAAMQNPSKVKTAASSASLDTKHSDAMILSLQEQVKALSQDKAALMAQLKQTYELEDQNDPTATSTTASFSPVPSTDTNPFSSTSFLEETTTVGVAKEEDTELATLTNMLLLNEGTRLKAQDRLDDAVRQRVRAEFFELNAKLEMDNIDRVSKDLTRLMMRQLVDSIPLFGLPAGSVAAAESSTSGMFAELESIVAEIIAEFSALDTDKNHVLDKTECPAPPRGVDANGDAKLTPAEVVVYVYNSTRKDPQEEGHHGRPQHEKQLFEERDGGTSNGTAGLAGATTASMLETTFTTARGWRDYVPGRGMLSRLCRGRNPRPEEEGEATEDPNSQIQDIEHDFDDDRVNVVGSDESAARVPTSGSPSNPNVVAGHQVVWWRTPRPLTRAEREEIWERQGWRYPEPTTRRQGRRQGNGEGNDN
ncbi:unnamed protein product [Amoebophrya sp. A120]|nr:unnamed protein product [Amoebophrya sp. A120]|eukprot:GSA120T00023756001.1